MGNRTGATRSRLSLLARGPIERLLAWTADTCAAAPRLVLAVALATAAGSIWLTVTRLQFQGSRDDIATATAIPHTARYLEFSREFPDDSSLVVIVDGRTRRRAEAFADALANRLTRLPEVQQVFHRIDPADFGGRALLYLPTRSLLQLRDALAEGQPVLAELAERPGLVPFVEAVNREVTQRLGQFAADDLLGPVSRSGAASTGGSLDAEGLATLFGALTQTVAGGPVPSLADAGIPGTPWARDPDSGEGQSPLGRPRYLATDNGRFLFVLVTPAKADDGGSRFFDGKAARPADRRNPVAAVRTAVAETRNGFPGLEVGVTGPTALEADEQSTTRRDMTLAALLGFAGNVVPLVLLFRRRARVGYVLLCLGVGLAWSFGFVTLAIGHLNMLSAVFASILIGIGINFPIHLLARYEEAEREGSGPATALGLMLVRTGGAVGASALVLVAAALATTVADLPAIAELGIISAAGLALSLLASYTVFPALLVLDRPTEDHPTGAPVLALQAAAVSTPASGRLARRLGQARWPLVAGVLLTLAGGGLALWRPPTFDSNLLNLQARESESVRYERLLIAEGGLSTSFILTDAADFAEVARKSEALRTRPLVSHVESALDVIPEAQPAKAQIIRAIRPLLTGVEVRREAAPAFALEPFRSAVSRLAFKLGAASDKGKGTAEARKALVDLLGTIDRVGASTAANRLAAAQAALLEEFADGLAFLKANLKPAPITPDSLPEGLRARFTGESGRLLLRIHPKENTWERAAMARFLADVRTVEPGVTGPRVQGFEVTEAIGRDYARATVVALVAIGLLTLFLFRNVKEALLAVIPLAAGGLWTLGVMAAFGIDFNLANLFAVPLVIGVAVDSGMIFIGRAREERAEATALLGRSVGKSMLLASLTTIWGFAALLPAHHRGIASLGLLLTLGTALTSLAAFTVLPPAVGAVARYRAARQARREGTLAAAAALLIVLVAGGALVAGVPGGIRTASAAPATVGAVDAVRGDHAQEGWEDHVAAPAVGPVDAVRGTIKATLAIMRDPALSPKTRDERIRRVIAERFDTEAMGRAALGPHDEQLAPGQRAEYTDLFATLFTRSYSRMVLSFLDRVEVRYGDAAPADAGVVVSTTLLKSRGETLPVEYRLKPRDDGWIFTDVVIDGLSLVASYRSQFDQVIRTNGTGSLLDRMRARRDRER